MEDHADNGFGLWGSGEEAVQGRHKFCYGVVARRKLEVVMELMDWR